MFNVLICINYYYKRSAAYKICHGNYGDFLSQDIAAFLSSIVAYCRSAGAAAAYRTVLPYFVVVTFILSVIIEPEQCTHYLFHNNY